MKRMHAHEVVSMPIVAILASASSGPATNTAPDVVFFTATPLFHVDH